jgi:hypothetical protein
MEKCHTIELLIALSENIGDHMKYPLIAQGDLFKNFPSPGAYDA